MSRWNWDLAELEGRMATCYCGAEEHSSPDLPFFTYRGRHSDEELMCVCGKSRVAHEKEGVAANVDPRTVVEMGECSGFRSRGPSPVDDYYCGCRGWD